MRNPGDTVNPFFFFYATDFSIKKIALDRQSVGDLFYLQFDE